MKSLTIQYIKSVLFTNNFISTSIIFRGASQHVTINMHKKDIFINKSNILKNMC